MLNTFASQTAGMLLLAGSNLTLTPKAKCGVLSPSANETARMALPISLPSDTPLWVQIVVAAVVVASVVAAIYAHWRKRNF